MGEEPRAAVAAQVRHDHPIAVRDTSIDVDIGEAVDVVRPAVKQQDGASVGRAGIDVADVEQPGLDLPDGPELARP